MKGIELKDYLTVRTLVAKCVGLGAALASGMPVGKEVRLRSNCFSDVKGMFQRFFSVNSLFCDRKECKLLFAVVKYLLASL